MNPLAARLASAFTAALIGASAHAQEARTLELSQFDSIDVSSGVTVKCQVGEPQSVVVETNKGDFKDIKIDVEKGVLRISRSWSRLAWHSSKINYTVLVSVPDLRALDGSEGADIEVAAIDAKDFVIDVSSGAHAYLEGKSENCIVDISSGGYLKAIDLICGALEIDVSSGGHGKMQVDGPVAADASSGGHVVIFGNPTLSSIDQSSGGRVKVRSLSDSNDE